MEPLKKECDGKVYIVPPPPTTKDYLPPYHCPEEKKSCFHIDKPMVRYKLHFFLLLGAFGISSPFLPLIAKSHVGLSASALATIMTTQQFLFVFTKSLIGYIADYFNKLKAMICILAVIQGIACFLLLPIPKIYTNDDKCSIQRLSFEQSIETALRYERCELDKLNKSFSTVLDGVNNVVICTSKFVAHPEVPDKCILSIITQSDVANETITSSSNEVRGELNVTITDPHVYKPLTEVICGQCCDFNANCFVLICPSYCNTSVSISSQESQYFTKEFWLFATICTAATSCMNALYTLSDTATCESAHISGSHFGKQRLWGAIGWGVMSPLAGHLNDIFEDYLASFILMGVLTTLSLWNLYKMDVVKPHFSQNILKDVGNVLRSGEFLAFEVGVLMNGMGYGILRLYLAWFVISLGGSELLCGLIQAVNCFAGEVPLMFYSEFIIKKIGHSNVTTLSLLGYCVRFMGYSFLNNPWFVLLFEALHGLTYGLLYPNIASYAKKSAKPGTETTTQSVLFSTHDGLGAGLGCVLAGLSIDYLGGHKTFFIAGGCAGFGLILNILFTLGLRKKSEKNTLNTH